VSRDRGRRPPRDLQPRISRRRGTSERLRRRTRTTGDSPRRSLPRNFGGLVRPAIRLLVLAAQLALLVALINSPALAAHQVSITGNRQLSRQQVLDRAGLSGDPPMLLLSTDWAEAQLKSNPYVRSVSVRTTLPDQVEIELLEWEPLAVVGRGGGFYLLNAQGAILGIAPDAHTGAQAGQPHVTITWAAPGLMTVGQAALPGRLVQDLDRMSTAFPSAYGLTISGFALDANQRLTANTSAWPRILFGQMATDEQIDSLDAKLGSLRSLRAKIDLADSKLDYVDLENPAAVTTRAIPSPTPSLAPSPSPTKKPK
jgi:cell division septal protein FtsQ